MACRGIGLTSIGNLPSGNYSVNMTDAANCCKSYPFPLASPTNFKKRKLRKCGVLWESTGSATLSASGGMAPYTYQWPNCGNCPSVNNLSNGIYFVNVIDAHGCSATTPVTISQPFAALVATATGSDETFANGNDCTVSATKWWHSSLYL